MSEQGRGSLRRFVFEMLAPHEPEHERVWHGSIREVRAEDEQKAVEEISRWGAVVHNGVGFRIVGERFAIGRGARFLPFVPDDQIPEVIVRLERVVGLEKRVA